MAAEKNDSKPLTIEVPVARNANGVGVDVKQTLVNAEKVANAFATQDAEASKAVAATAQKILNDTKYKDEKSFTASTIAKMALGAMGEIPTDKLCSETEERVKSFLRSQPDKYLHIERGRLSGFHIKSRYKKDDLEKLQKAADAAIAKAAADAKEAAESAVAE